MNPARNRWTSCKVHQVGSQQPVHFLFRHIRRKVFSRQYLMLISYIWIAFGFVMLSIEVLYNRNYEYNFFMESLSQSILINGGFLQRSNRRQWPKVYWLWSCWTNGVLSVLSERYSSTHCWLSRSMPSFLTEFYRLCSLASSTYCSLFWWQAVCRQGKSFQEGPSRYTPCRHTVFFWCRPKISLALRVLGHPHSP